jgi:uncharacterized low-complexity protein
MVYFQYKNIKKDKIMKNLFISSFMTLALVAFVATSCTASESSDGVEKSIKSAKCGTGKCGDGKTEAKKCGDGKTEAKKSGDGKTTTKKCGDGEAKKEASKCGAGKCGGGK